MRRLTKKNKNGLRQVRHARVRARLSGTAQKPRLSVFRSLRSITAQLINDEVGKTLCQASAKEVGKEKAEGYTGKSAVAYLVGKAVAQKAKSAGVTKIVFDRGGYQYHGRVKALAEGARAGGLEF
jgi:large subunit ribosomal protein L18